MSEKLARTREDWRQPENNPQESANYQGDFALLQRKRVQSAAIKNQIVKLLYEQDKVNLEREKREGPNHFDEGFFSSTKVYARHHAKRIALEEPDIREITREVNKNIRMSTNVPRLISGTGSPNAASISLDWISASGKKLTPRELSMAIAHEQGHVFRAYSGKWLKEYFISGFDTSKVVFTQEYYDLSKEFAKIFVKSPSGEFIRTELSPEDLKKKFIKALFDPNEIAERMAQLKNYFGMSGNEEFTKAHLVWAREHFIKDLPGCDNGMTHFFQAITPETEERFLYLINNSGI